MATCSTIGASAPDCSCSPTDACSGAGAGLLVAVEFATVAMSGFADYAVQYSMFIERLMTPEEIAALQAKAAKVDELEQRLAAVDNKKGEILDEKKTLQQQLQELQQKQAEREKQDLEQQGRTAELLKLEQEEKAELAKRIAELEKEKDDLAQKSIKDRLKSDFVSAVSGEAFVPDQLWTIFQSAAQDSDGKTVISFKGSKVSPSELVGKLRSDPEYAHHFRPRQGSGGMGSKPATGSADISGNPYAPGGSVTARIELELRDPDLAAKLKEEASSARASR